MDRNGAVFRHILDFLRDGTIYSVKSEDRLALMAEAKFFELEALQEQIALLPQDRDLLQGLTQLESLMNKSQLAVENQLQALDRKVANIELQLQTVSLTGTSPKLYIYTQNPKP